MVEELLLSKGFNKNWYDESKVYYEYEDINNNERTKEIAKLFGAGHIEYDIKCLILQCDEIFTNCLLYIDCVDWTMSTEEFIACVKQM